MSGRPQRRTLDNRSSTAVPQHSWRSDPGACTYSALMSYGLRDLDGVRVELCDECGFDAREPRNLGSVLAEAFASLEQLVDHTDTSRRPQEETWSGTEYAEHCIEVAGEIVAISNRAAGRPEAAPPGSL